MQFHRGSSTGNRYALPAVKVQHVIFTALETGTECRALLFRETEEQFRNGTSSGTACLCRKRVCSLRFKALVHDRC